MGRRIWTKEELQASFRVNESGELERLYKGWRWGHQWRVIECVGNRYRQVRFNNSNILYHTILYILHHGTIEDINSRIIHANSDVNDNKIQNLQLSTTRSIKQALSTQNGNLLGACFDSNSGKYKASIYINDKRIHLGLFDTEVEAHKIYIKAINNIHLYVDAKQFRELLGRD